jgi:hypothetical protein
LWGFLRHILPARNAAHCFIGRAKRHIQPERYASFVPGLFGRNKDAAIRGGENIFKKHNWILTK